MKRLIPFPETAATIWMHDNQPSMQTCARLKCSSVQLPCGSRDECFGRTRCWKCPPEAKPPRRDLFGIVE